MSIKDNTAAQLLDKACKAENEGKNKTAEMALNLAVKRDAEEHESGTPSLPRK